MLPILILGTIWATVAITSLSVLVADAIVGERP